MTDRQQKCITLAAVLIFAVFSAAVGWLVGVPMIRLAGSPEDFRIWVDSYGLLGRLLFVGMVVLQVLIAFIPGEPVELAAGYAFGVAEGTMLTMAGFLLGSWLVYALVKQFGVKLVEVFFSKDQISRVGFLRNPKKAGVLAFVLMTIPGTPKDFLSYFAGLTPLSLRQWLAIVAFARLPSLLTSTVAGAAAGEKNYVLTAGMLLLSAIVSLIGIVYYRYLTKQELDVSE